MNKSIADQLKDWAVSTDQGSLADVTRGHIHASANGFSRDFRSDPSRYERTLPRSLLESEVRLQECQEALVDIDKQLSERGPTECADLAEFEAWKRRAVTARRGFEYEISRMDTCVRVFRREAAADAATVAVLQKERDDARDACRRLAEELEKLTEETNGFRSEASGSDASRAFVDVARVILSEVTFNRIMDRARDKANRKATV